MGKWKCDPELIMRCVFVSLGHVNQVFLVLSQVAHIIFPFDLSWLVLLCERKLEHRSRINVPLWTESKMLQAKTYPPAVFLINAKALPEKIMPPASFIHCHLTQVRLSEQWYLKQEHLNKKQRWGFSGRERGSGDAVCISLTPERAGSAGNHKVFYWEWMAEAASSGGGVPVSSSVEWLILHLSSRVIWRNS